jgi:hypothetical protein
VICWKSAGGGGEIATNPGENQRLTFLSYGTDCIGSKRIVGYAQTAMLSHKPRINNYEQRIYRETDSEVMSWAQKIRGGYIDCRRDTGGYTDSWTGTGGYTDSWTGTGGYTDSWKGTGGYTDRQAHADTQTAGKAQADTQTAGETGGYTDSRRDTGGYTGSRRDTGGNIVAESRDIWEAFFYSFQNKESWKKKWNLNGMGICVKLSRNCLFCKIWESFG